jgi:type IV pilus assembly protein PilX
MNTTMLTTAQKGSVLIVSMLILLVLTLIGVTAMGTSSLEEKMSGNSRDQDVAFQAAETGLRDAETFLEGIVATGGLFNNTGGLYALGANPDITLANTWSSTNSRAYTGTLPNTATQPRYIIELRPTVGGNTSAQVDESYGGSTNTPPITMFLITVRGTGGTDNAVVFLQAFYGRQL